MVALCHELLIDMLSQIHTGAAQFIDKEEMANKVRNLPLPNNYLRAPLAALFLPNKKVGGCTVACSREALRVACVIDIYIGGRSCHAGNKAA